MSQLTDEEINEAAKAPQNKKKKLIPSWVFLILIVIVILGARKYFYEPFKIPSGSMEPTLIGHPDYGDRILTEKFWNPKTADPDRFDIVVFEHSSEWNGAPENAAVKKNYIKRLIGKSKETIILSGGDVFIKEDGKARILRKWDEADGGSNRLQANLWQPVSIASFEELPVPKDVKPSDKTGEFEKWMEARRAGQENNRAFPWEVQPTQVESSDAEVTTKTQHKRSKGSVEVEGPLTLSYKHDVENVYVKMGRWPFRCINCPAHQRAVADKTVRHPDAPSSEYVLPYIPNTWGGVECPNCKQLKFPPSRFDNSVAGSPRLVPVRLMERGITHYMQQDIIEHKLANKSIKQEEANEYLKKYKFEQLENEPNPSGMEQLRIEKPMLSPKYLSASEESSNFFCGGYNKVGDLKLVVELEVLNADGSLQLEVGSNFHKAVWPLSLGGTLPEPKDDEQNHVVTDYMHKLSQGQKVLLSLTYVDGTVRAGVDGDIDFVKKVDATPLGKDELKLKSHLALKFNGNPRVRITRLEIYRDLYHTLFNDSSGFSATVGPVNRPSFPPPKGTQNVRVNYSLLGKYDPDTRTYTFKIPDGHYLMMGDNSPSSQDGRNWGYVPQESLIGRALLTWWPPSRWGTLE